MNKLFDFITINLWKLTHRIIIADKIGNHQFYMKKYIPQWWFIWWHYYWREIGYQFMIPISYDTLEEAEFMTNREISFEEKHAYWLRHIKEKMKLTDIERDFE